MFRHCLPFQRHNYIRKHVLIFSKVDENIQENKKLLKQFAIDYLRPDLVLVLKLLATNVNAMVVSELIKRLWDSYLSSLKKHDLSQQDSIDDTAQFPINHGGDGGEDILSVNLNKQNDNTESKQLLPQQPPTSSSNRNSPIRQSNSKRPSNA